MRIEGLSQNFSASGEASTQTQNAEMEKQNEELRSNYTPREVEDIVEIRGKSGEEVRMDYASYYMQAGRSYEGFQSYRQAMYSYERSFKISPSDAMTKLVNRLRNIVYSNNS